MSVESIYDFETAIEAAMSAMLVNAELMKFTPADPAQFQKERPRVECGFQCGPAKRSFHIVNGVQRNATWGGMLSLEILTASDAVGKKAHRFYRATVRNVMATAREAINELLTSHVIQGIYESSTSPDYKSDDGYEMSKLSYAVDFGVLSSAWEYLDSALSQWIYVNDMLRYDKTKTTFQMQNAAGEWQSVIRTAGGMEFI